MHPPPVVLAGPAGRCRLLALPHPRARAPAYFAAHEDGALYEVLVVRGERRSWFVAGGGGGQVLADGGMRVLSKVDPALVLVGVLAASPNFLPLDDLLDDAAERHAHASGRTNWPDIAELGAYAAHLLRVCDTQDADGQRMYRLSRDKVRALVDAKVCAVSAALPSAPETLGVHVRRLEDGGETGAVSRAAHELVTAYLSPETEAWLG